MRQRRAQARGGGSAGLQSGAPRRSAPRSCHVDAAMAPPLTRSSAAKQSSSAAAARAGAPRGAVPRASVPVTHQLRVARPLLGNHIVQQPVHIVEVGDPAELLLHPSRSREPSAQQTECAVTDAYTRKNRINGLWSGLAQRAIGQREPRSVPLSEAWFYQCKIICIPTFFNAITRASARGGVLRCHQLIVTGGNRPLHRRAQQPQLRACAARAWRADPFVMTIRP